MSEPASPFEYASSFEPGEVAGGVRLGRLEAQYEELFSEAIEDGVITPDERARLERAAEALGIDRARLHQLERALTAAYEARRRVRVRELAATPAGDVPDDVPAPVAEDAPVPDDAPAAVADDGPHAAPAPPSLSADQRSRAMERRIKALETRVRELEQELEDLQAQTAVEVDLSGVVADASPASSVDDPEELLRRLRREPRDGDVLHALFRAFVHHGDTDRAWCAAHALTYLGAAGADERELHVRLRPDGLVRPSAALSREGWQRLLFHPEQEPMVGEIFAVVLGPVLLGRITALRRDGKLARLDPQQRQDPRTATVTAVRCFAWAATILGVQLPPLYADPSDPGTAVMVPATAPSLRLGRAALSGRTPAELAFLAGEHLGYFRDDVFMRALFDGITELEDIFLAALSIGNPGIPLSAAVRARVTPIAQAIEPLLEPVQIDRLRGHFLRFVEEGGRTNLQRWAMAADATATRAGLLLAGDLQAADAVLRLESAGQVEERMDDLILFTVGERYAKLRRQLGVAVG
jgi:hypothetical protein